LESSGKNRLESHRFIREARRTSQDKSKSNLPAGERGALLVKPAMRTKHVNQTNEQERVSEWRIASSYEVNRAMAWRSAPQPSPAC